MTELPPIQPVEISVEPDIVLRAQFRNSRSRWVILLHDEGSNEDLDRWGSLDAELAMQGWSVLAVDIRGHGASDGRWDASAAVADAAAVAEWVRSRGADFVGFVAAGASAIAVLKAATLARPDAIVALSPRISPDQSLAELRGAGEAKLIVVGGGDPEARADGERLCNAAIGWVLLVNLPASEHGTALLTGSAASSLREHLFGFLRERSYLAALRRASVSEIGRQRSETA
jgi:pimeloyl-ACP methyl ester carboxylesterase